MKLASLNDDSPDGQLVVVSKDLKRFVSAGSIASSMRAAMDDWEGAAPKLAELAQNLEGDPSLGQAFNAQQCMAPLPRATQWADGSAYVNHVELVRKARGAELPESFWEDPLMYMGAPDAMLGPHDDIVALSEAWGIDMEGETAVITGELPMGVSAEEAGDYIRLIVLLNDISFRNLIPGELAKGFGFFQSKGPTAFAPVAVTPDELGDAWRDGKVHRQMLVTYNGKPFGKADAGIDMTFNFPQLLAHAAKTRNVKAGAIVGSGTVSNKDQDGSPGKPVDQGGKGYSCIAEIRMIETIENGKPETAFMSFGDTVALDMQDDAGNSIFGRIEQKVVEHG